MPESFDPHHNDNPTTAEMFRVFRETTMASISGMKLLLDECADLRGDLITIHSLHDDGDGDGVFSARQQSRILELRETAKAMGALFTSLP